MSNPFTDPETIIVFPDGTEKRFGDCTTDDLLYLMDAIRNAPAEPTLLRDLSTLPRPVVAASTRAQAEGAYPNGTRVVKISHVDSDGSGSSLPLGSEGVVIGSVRGDTDEFAYFVEWDSHPGVPVLTRGRKLAEVVL